MVWHSSRVMGCGVSECNNNTALWVCHYHPVGNVIGQLPFSKRNKPSDMGECDNVDALPDPMPVATPKKGSCLSDGTLCSVAGAGGVTTCGGGVKNPIYGCRCAKGIRGSDGQDCSPNIDSTSSSRRLMSAIVLCSLVAVVQLHRLL